MANKRVAVTGAVFSARELAAKLSTLPAGAAASTEIVPWEVKELKTLAQCLMDKEDASRTKEEHFMDALLYNFAKGPLQNRHGMD